MKIKIDNYTFDKTARTVTLTDYTTIRLDGLLLITNVTDNIIIYNFADTTKGGTVLNNIITLTYNTSEMDNSDKLLIYYDDTDVVPVTAEDITNKDIMIALKALILAITYPPYVDRSSNQMRAVVSGTVTSSTTVAVSDITLKGAYQPRIEVIASNIGAWSTLVRNRIT